MTRRPNMHAAAIAVMAASFGAVGGVTPHASYRKALAAQAFAILESEPVTYEAYSDSFEIRAKQGDYSASVFVRTFGIFIYLSDGKESKSAVALNEFKEDLPYTETRETVNRILAKNELGTVAGLLERVKK